MHQGEIWWGELPDQKGRPYLLMTRQSALEVLSSVVVAPVTTKVRGVISEVRVGPADGLRLESAASLDNLAVMPKALLVRRIGALAPGRWHEVCGAMRAAINC